MSEKMPAIEKAIFPETPDETISVEDYGAQMLVEVWHSPVPKIKTTFSYTKTDDTDKTMSEEPWVRQEKRNILNAKARLVGLIAIAYKDRAPH